MRHKRGHSNIMQMKDSLYSRQEAYRFPYHQILCSIKGKVKFLVDIQKQAIKNIFIVSSEHCQYIKYTGQNYQKIESLKRMTIDLINMAYLRQGIYYLL